MQIDRHAVRVTAVVLVMALAAFVVVHDMGTGVSVENRVANAAASQDEAPDPHVALALCAIALVLVVSCFGVRAAPYSPRRPIQVLLVPLWNPVPRTVARSRLFELCVIRA